MCLYAWLYLECTLLYYSPFTIIRAMKNFPVETEAYSYIYYTVLLSTASYRPAWTPKQLAVHNVRQCVVFNQTLCFVDPNSSI